MPERIASLYAEISADTTKFKNGLRDVDKSLRDTEKQVKKTSGPITNFLDVHKTQIAGVTLGLAALKKGWDFSSQGAELLTLDTRFDRLATSIGSSGTALKDKLLVSMGGLVSDSQAVSTAVDLMSLGLAKSEDQVLRLSTVSSQLGMDMNQLVLALTNQTTARFDQLNVSVDGFDERLKKLQATGLSAQDAFTEAFLQQAEAQIERVGSVTETTEGKFLRAEATINNFTDDLKKMSAIGIGTAITAFQQLGDLMGHMEKQADDARLRVAQTSQSYEEYADRIVKVWGVQHDMRQGDIEYYQQLARTGEMTDAQRNRFELLTQTQWENMQIMKAYTNDAVSPYAYAVQDAASSTNSLQDGVGGVSDAMRAQAQDAKNAKQALADYYDLVSTGIPSFDFMQQKDTMDWLDAGGQQLVEFNKYLEKMNILAGTGVVTQEQYTQELKNGAIAQSALNFATGELSKSQAWNTARDISEEWGGNVRDIYDYIIGINDYMDLINGKTSKLTIDLKVTGDNVPPIGGTGGGLGPPPTVPKATTQATGGPLADAAIIGEQGYEAVIGGYVYTHQQTKAMLNSGMISAPKGFASGGNMQTGGKGGGLNVTNNFYAPVQLSSDDTELMAKLGMMLLP